MKNGITVILAALAFVAAAENEADAIMMRKPTVPKVEAPKVEVEVPKVEVEAPKVEAKTAAEEKKAEEKKVEEEAFAEDKPVAVVKAEEAKVEAKKPAKKKGAARDARITSIRTTYNRKDGVILFDGNVCVNDDEYQMHANRVFVFLDGTNDLRRIVAIGDVAITNGTKTAVCAKATYSKPTGKIVMYSSEDKPARLHEAAKNESDVVGEMITFWLGSEQVEVENPVITLPGSAIKNGDAKKKLLGK